MRRKLIKYIFIFVIIMGIAAAYIVSQLFPKTYSEYIDAAAEQYNVDSMWLRAVIKAESNFDKNAVSKADAKGLMQLTDKTADWCASSLRYGEYDIFDPETNINLGTFYLSYLLNKYEGNKNLAVAAYNAGYSKVDSWLLDKDFSDDGKTLKEIPYPETRRHVKKVEIYENIYDIILSQSE